jgi:uncharacterized damage-inducible protein DinB
MPTSYLFQITNTPAALIRMIDIVRPERYDEKLADDAFTLRENIAHLADWEETCLDRITIAVEYPGKEVPNYDVDARAAEHHFSTKDVHHELEVFDNRRRDTMAYLLGLADDDWSKTVIHPTRGEITVKEMVQFIVGHDMYHLHQVSQFLG